MRHQPEAIRDGLFSLNFVVLRKPKIGLRDDRSRNPDHQHGAEKIKMGEKLRHGSLSRSFELDHPRKLPDENCRDGKSMTLMRA
jgi:hypothetical protein